MFGVVNTKIMDKDNTTHFNEKERLLLAQLVSEETCIENKKTNAVDLKDKADAWERITKKYVSEGCAPRSTKQLRKCWDNMKQRKRKLNTSMRHERLMTGGGPAAKQPNDPVMDFMDVVSSIETELDCPFDSTAAFEKEYNVRVEAQASNEDENEDTIEEDHSTTSTCSKNRTAPSVSHSKKSEKQITVNRRNIENIQDEKELRLVKLREAIEQQRELHSKKMKIAEVEEKIVLVKLLKEEEALRQSF